MRAAWLARRRVPPLPHGQELRSGGGGLEGARGREAVGRGRFPRGGGSFGLRAKDSALEDCIIS